MPFNCPCGEKLTLSQALHCAKDEYTHKRQEDPRQDVCYDVEVEPTHDNFVIEDNKSICPALDRARRILCRSFRPSNATYKKWHEKMEPQTGSKLYCLNVMLSY